VQELVIEGWLPTQIANGTARTMHWTKKREIKQSDELRVELAAREAGWRPILTGRPRLEITMVFPNRRRRDWDNLYARCKALVDGITAGGFLVDDDTDHLDLVVHRPVVERGRTATLLRLVDGVVN
jgi:Holliday junction resolvase RusA-like endonuclease